MTITAASPSVFMSVGDVLRQGMAKADGTLVAGATATVTPTGVVQLQLHSDGVTVLITAVKAGTTLVTYHMPTGANFFQNITVQSKPADVLTIVDVT